MGIKLVATNRKANHNYKIIEKYEAGMVLTGSEVKSIRNNKISIKESYVRIIHNELFIGVANIIFHYAGEHELERDRVKGEFYVAANGSKRQCDDNFASLNKNYTAMSYFKIMKGEWENDIFTGPDEAEEKK